MESCCECATKKLCWRWRRHSLRYNYAPWVDYTGWNISSHYRPTAKQVLRAELTQSVMNAVHGLKAVITVREITIVSNVPSDKLCGMASGYVQWIDAFVVHLCPDKLFITTVTNILDQKLVRSCRGTRTSCPTRNFGHTTRDGNMAERGTILYPSMCIHRVSI